MEKLYEVICHDIETKILTGDLRADSLIPSARVLAQEYQVNIGTVNKAFSFLHEEGILKKMRGKGFAVMPFAKDQVYKKRVDQLDQTIKEAKAEAELLGLDIKAELDKMNG